VHSDILILKFEVFKICLCVTVPSKSNLLQPSDSDLCLAPRKVSVTGIFWHHVAERGVGWVSPVDEGWPWEGAAPTWPCTVYFLVPKMRIYISKWLTKIQKKLQLLCIHCMEKKPPTCVFLHN